jgi:hypothetical protein
VSDENVYSVEFMRLAGDKQKFNEIYQLYKDQALKKFNNTV